MVEVDLRPALLREAVGETLRETRTEQGRTLREVSADARVSLGYLSEVERGQKEASSELLASICESLGVPLSSVLRTVSDKVANTEPVKKLTITPKPLDTQAYAA
ncbi:helix-turn-helix protein [Naumannella halotolerans]|uniref:Helix-turn-helix protein n=1 Tax=Naumannella halotolerans TaxID=993414 RepID=A0A4V3ENE0_9ACTN|nr:helix-turn-helix protein [Naumannella halotolerans]